AFGSGVTLFSAFFDPPWEGLAPGLRDREQSWILIEAGFALQALGRLPEAEKLTRLALERDIARGEWNDAAIAADNLSDLLRSRGGLREALAQARRSVDFAEESGHAGWRAAFHATLAAALHAMGLREEANVQFQEAERLQNVWRPDE